jgi:hypothetical protein
MALPGTEEGTSYGTPAWKVRGRGSLRLRTEADGGLVVPVEDLGAKAAMLASDPRAYITTPHRDGYPTFLVHLEDVAGDELEELITEAWRLPAPARLRRSVDAQHPPRPSG